MHPKAIPSPVGPRPHVSSANMGSITNLALIAVKLKPAFAAEAEHKAASVTKCFEMPNHSDAEDLMRSKRGFFLPSSVLEELAGNFKVSVSTYWFRMLTTAMPAPVIKNVACTPKFAASQPPMAGPMANAALARTLPGAKTLDLVRPVAMSPSIFCCPTPEKLVPAPIIKRLPTSWRGVVMKADKPNPAAATSWPFTVNGFRP
mmetsp:Transcript_32388/g.48869  ORF Transcript_32388/g.48869 Transcript_32388/m.48869 type:complete len:203 (-) Transcript_32388:574-1182(-)